MTHPIINKILFILLLFLCISVSGQSINDVVISGNNNFSENEYLSWINLPTGSPGLEGIIDTVKERIGKGLKENGYFNFNFENISISHSSDSSSITINVLVQEGEPTYINEIYLENLSDSELSDIGNNFDYLKGQVYSKFDLEYSINEVLNYFENIGYPFVSVLINSLYFFQDSAGMNMTDIYLRINKESKTKIDSLEISGNTKTKDYVIIRNLRLEEGTLYSQENIDEIPKKLNRLRFFLPVETPKFYYNNENKGVLQIKVAEKETNNFDGIIGYVPGRTDKEKGYLTGFVNISLRNLFGTERGFAFKWLQEARNSQELEIKYFEPWIFNYPFNLQFSLFQRKQDTTYVSRKLSGALEYLATENISIAFLVQNESTIPSEGTVSDLIIRNSSSINTGLNLSIDTRDDVYAPTEGFYLISTYIYSSKNFKGSTDFGNKISLQKLEFDFTFFYELFQRQVGAIKLNLREIRGNFTEISDLYRFGGTNTLRGYRENQFVGNRLFWSNLEYRYLLTNRSYIFLFFDSGYYLQNESPENKIPRLTDFLTGYGLGLSIETPLGVIGVSYALAEGSSLGEGLIHFGLLNEF